MLGAEPSEFAEIESARIRAIPLEQHIAEKLHAYTRRYGNDEPSSRAKVSSTSSS